MATIKFTVSLDEEKDSELIDWLSSTENRSYEIKAALRAYRNLPPPPPPNDGGSSPQPFDPSGLIHAVEAMTLAADRMANATERLEQRFDAIETSPIPIPLNGKKKKKQPERQGVDEDRIFEEAMSGIDSWGN